MSDQLPKSVEMDLARSPVLWSWVTSLTEHLRQVDGLYRQARMSPAPIGQEALPLFDYSLCHDRASIFRIIAGEDVIISFWTRRDLDQFISSLKLENAPQGRALWAPKSYRDNSLDLAVAIKLADLDPSTVARALCEICETSFMRNLIPRSDDLETERLLRNFFVVIDEHHFDATYAELVDHLKEDNIDFVLGKIADISPWATEDPDSVPGTILILLDGLVREQGRCFPEAHHHLLNIRDDFERIGGQARHDIVEVDDLLRLIQTKAN